MSAKTKIVVLHTKKIIFTIVVTALILIAALLVVAIFHPGKPASADTQTSGGTTDIQSEPTAQAASNSISESTQTAVPPSSVSQTPTEEATETMAVPTYHPGIYTSTIMLGDAPLDIQVTVDRDHINAITLKNLDNTMETMYPLISPSLDEISKQIITQQSLDAIELPADSKYTSMLLFSAIEEALNKAVSE